MAKLGEKIRPLQTYHEVKVRNDWERYRGERYWEYRRLWSELPEKMIVSEFPLHLDIETTTICNLKCPMCPRTVSIQKEEFSSLGIMTYEDFSKIIDEGTKNNLYSIKLNYLGEPLMHPEVVKQVQYAKNKGIEDVMFNTNGTLLDKEMSEGLLKAGIDKLFISFDSPYAKNYEHIRVGAKFDDVIKNIKYFYLRKMKEYPHVQVRVSMVMLDSQEKVYEDYVELFKHTVDAIGFDEFRDTEDRTNKPVVEGFACAQLFQRMFLRLNGDVTVCCADDKSGYIVGNWKRQPLKDIWNGREYDHIRSLHKKGLYHSHSLCSKCNVPLAQERAISRKTLPGAK